MNKKRQHYYSIQKKKCTQRCNLVPTSLIDEAKKARSGVNSIELLQAYFTSIAIFFKLQKNSFTWKLPLQKFYYFFRGETKIYLNNRTEYFAKNEFHTPQRAQETTLTSFAHTLANPKKKNLTLSNLAFGFGNKRSMGTRKGVTKRVTT